MTARVFFDTNIVLDVLTDRQPFADASCAAWAAIEERRCVGLVSAITMTTVFYITRKCCTKAAARAAITTILDVFTVIATNETIIRRGIHLPLDDFEDAVQYATAMVSKADVILSRNVGDFPKQGIPVLTPATWLAQLQ
jgi:predicted nucleic acid-binding protein